MLNLITTKKATYSEGTVKPYQPFNPMDDAAKIYKAMKGKSRMKL
jgi:hypothetical protein